MVFKRRLGRKGQIVIPKAIREILGIGPGDEVVMEIREKEVVIKPEADPVRFVEDFCSIVGQKLTERIDLEKLFWGRG
jgi:AbrB family looped-hinge helix DNA binding protein